MQVLDREPAPVRALNPAVDRDLEAVCLKCLEKEPQRRYASAGELARDLDRYQRGDSVSASSTGVFERLVRTLGRSHLGAEYHAWGTTLLLFAPIVLGMQLAVYAVNRVRVDLLWVGLTQALQFPLMGLVYWRWRPRGGPAGVDERQLWSIWAGYLVACYIIGTSSFMMFEREKLYEYCHYPYLSALSGLAFFALGNSYWGRCYLFGIAFFVLSVLMPLRLSWSPLGFGLLWAWCLVSIGLYLHRMAGEAPDGLATDRSSATSGSGAKRQ
jgi:serine/threonine-protein kinase